MATKPNVTTSGANFGDLSFYTSGFGLPDGDWILTFVVQNFQATNAQGQTNGPMRLGVMVKALPLSEPLEANAKDQFYSMGGKAHESFAPNAETGKGIVPIPGASGSLNHSSNWAIFLKSLYDSGLPEGVFSNDLTVLDGIHVHTTQVPEPEDRKGFQSSTGETQQERKANKIAIVTEIKDDGKPWEGTGGVPKASTKSATKPAAKPVPVVAKPTVTAKAAPEETVEVDEELAELTKNGITAVLEKNPNGCSRIALRTGTFKYFKDVAKDEDKGNQALTVFFASDTELNPLLEEMGYICKDGKVTLA